MVELRWTVPEGTTTERPRLQYRVCPPVIMFGSPSGWSEWMDVPMVVVPQQSRNAGVPVSTNDQQEQQP